MQGGPASPSQEKAGSATGQPGRVRPCRSKAYASKKSPSSVMRVQTSRTVPSPTAIRLSQ
jgi:hypothetical protein